MTTALPLAGIRVIDCGQLIAAPTLTGILGDFGADVLKIEPPVGGDMARAFGKAKDGVSLFAKLLSRNKRSVTLDLRQPAGQELLCELIVEAKIDVLVESFRPGTFERWNLGAERLRRLRPELIVVHVSGFGQSGPYRDRPGFGTLAEAMSGFADMTGPADAPPTLPPFALADHVAALNGVIGVMVALYTRSQGGTGKGQEIDLSLLEPMINMLGIYSLEYQQLGTVPRRQGNRTGSAPRDVYRTLDGRWIAIAGSSQAIVERLFTVIGRPELIREPSFRTNRDRLDHVAELDGIVGPWVAERTLAQALDELTAGQVAAAPVMGPAELARDPHLSARGAYVEIEDGELGTVRLPAVQPRLSDDPGAVRWAGPPLGEHTEAVLTGWLGKTPEEIEELRARGVI